VLSNAGLKVQQEVPERAARADQVERDIDLGRVTDVGSSRRVPTRETDGDPAGINRCAVGLGGGSCVDADQHDVLQHFNSASLQLSHERSASDPVDPQP
jgi:hypothetical protein